MLYSFLNRVSKIKSTQCKSCIKQFLPEKELQEEANMQQSIASHTSGTVHTHTYRLQYNLNFLFCMRLDVVHMPKQVNTAARSLFCHHGLKQGENLFTPACPGKYVTYSASNKANQEHSAPQKKLSEIRPLLPATRTSFPALIPVKLPPYFHLLLTAFLRIECKPRNWFPNCKISDTAKCISLVLTGMAEEPEAICIVFSHTENLYRTRMTGCLK